jgi:hypothetical protein
MFNDITGNSSKSTSDVSVYYGIKKDQDLFKNPAIDEMAITVLILTEIFYNLMQIDINGLKTVAFNRFQS